MTNDSQTLYCFSLEVLPLRPNGISAARASCSADKRGKSPCYDIDLIVKSEGSESSSHDVSTDPKEAAKCMLQ